MKRPEITIEEFGAFGPDGLEMKIVRGDETIATFLFHDEMEGKIITGMLDALIKVYALNGFSDSGIRYLVEQALQDAGVEL